MMLGILPDFGMSWKSTFKMLDNAGGGEQEYFVPFP